MQHPKTLTRLTIGLSALLLALSACGHNENATTGSNADEIIDAVPVELVSGSVVLHPTITSMCEISAAHAYFEYNSANLNADNMTFVDQLARCITSGALKGHDLKLVGRADPRGPTRYNDKLGRKRAQSVANALTSRGVAPGRLDVVSRGERGFSEDNSALAYAIQRRVDIQLANPRQSTMTMVYWDYDDNGVITSDEFFTYFSGMYDHDAWDTNKDGWLNPRELSTGLYRVWDLDLDGALSPDEYQRGVTGWYRSADFHGDFATWDTNNDARIDRAEWDQGVVSYNIYSELDVNGDKKLYEDELSTRFYQHWDRNNDNTLDPSELKNIPNLKADNG